MTYPTCKTCKYWNPRPAWHPLGGLMAVIHDCENNLVNSGDQADGLFAASEDDETYVMTGPDFGCIHHEEKK